jgi:hypothetical protein
MRLLRGDDEGLLEFGPIAHDADTAPAAASSRLDHQGKADPIGERERLFRPDCLWGTRDDRDAG